MEVQFLKMMETLDVTPDQVSKGIQNDIKLFDESWADYEAAYQDYSSCSDPQEKVVLMEELNVFEQDLTQMDAAICKKIQLWDKNKESYALKVQKMAEGRERKKAEQANKTNDDVAIAEPPVDEPQPAIDPQPDLSGTVVMADGGMSANGVYNTTDTIPEPQQSFDPPPSTKEEKSDLGWWILGGAIAILTLGVGAKFLKK